MQIFEDAYFVEVTQEDIDNGVPGKPNECTVSLALKRLPNVDRVSVSPQVITLFNLDKSGSINMVRSYWHNASGWILMLERQSHVLQPFSFLMNPFLESVE